MKKLLLKLSNYIKQNWIKVLVISLIVVTCLLLAIPNYLRVWISIKSLARNFWFNLTYRYEPGKKIIYPRQTIDDLLNLASSGTIIEFFLPIDWNIFKERFLLGFHAMINLDILKYYGYDVLYTFYLISKFLTIVIYAFLICLIVFNFQSYVENSLPIDSKLLTKYKKIRNKVYPFYCNIKKWIKDNLLTDSLKRIFIILLLLDLGLLPIILDSISELLIFFSGFNLIIFWNYLVVAFSDIIRFLLSTSPIIYIPFLLILFDKWRKSHALKVLNKHDESNKKFYESTGNIILFTGASGTGKTTMLVDAVLTIETSIRNDKLLKIIHRQEAKFPNFNWRQLESEIDRLSNNGKIKTRVDLINYVNELYKTFKSTGQLLGYDTKNSKLIVWDELTADSIFNSIKNYATAYFFYRIEKPLSIAATGIYHDLGVSKDKHYFPLYNPNYFSETLDDYLKRIKENYATIIDYNFMRMGNKKTHLDEKGKAMKNDPYLYNIGVIAMPECDKERGSYADLRSMSESDEACNQVNDLFYIYQTIMRHNTELDHEILHKIIMDDQDLMKLNPELRQLVETVITLDRNQRKSYNALFLWWIDETLCEAIIKAYHFINDTRKQYKRNDSLFTYLIRNLVNKVEMYYMRRVNRFGYDKLGLYTTNSSLDDVSNESGKEVLYLSYKKLYSGRFDDVYLKSLFLSIEKNATISINDLARFESITPSVSEFAQQNSFLYDSYFSIFNSGKRR